jgi:hypothetical protein
MLVSIYENATSKKFKDVEINELLNAVHSGRWAKKVEYLRSLDKDLYKVNKVYLPAICWSGTFKERNNKGLNQYSGLVVLDIDNINSNVIRELKDRFIDDNKNVLAAFTSPSGHGIKIIVPVNTGPEHHLAAFLHLQKVFERDYCLKVDDSGKDVARLCFVSYDPEAHWNPQAVPFEVDIRYGEVKTYVVPEGLKNYKAQGNTDVIFKTCIAWVERTIQYAEGSRNRFIHALGCAMNRVGVEMEITQSCIKSAYDLDQKEIDDTVKKAYFQNQGEHGSVEFKDMGAHEFVAPPYVQNYTDDVVVNDIMVTTALLTHHGVPNDKIYDILSKVGRYYQAKGFIDLRRQPLGVIMNNAVKALNAKTAEITDKHKLEYKKAQDVGRDLVKLDVNEGCIPTHFPSIDGSMRGGLQPGGFYGLVGVGGTYKSILAQFFSVAAAYKDKGVLFINGEMAERQFYERLCSMTLKINLYQKLASKEINEENIENVILEINNVLHDNLFLVSGAGFTKQSILSTIDNIKAVHGKKIGLVIIDGLTQFDSGGLDDIKAAVPNSEKCKDISKEANGGEGTAVIALAHISGDQADAITRRDNRSFVRGGGKVLSACDGVFCTSLLVDPKSNSLENNGDITYLEDKFYVRYIDKRAGTGTVSVVINVGAHIELREDENDPRNYEVKL